MSREPVWCPIRSRYCMCETLCHEHPVSPDEEYEMDRADRMVDEQPDNDDGECSIHGNLGGGNYCPRCGR